MRQFMGTHPSIFNFITKLKIEQHEQELIMAQIEGGADPPPRRMRYTKNDERIFKLVKKFDSEIQDGSFLPYLKSIAHNASL